MSAISNPHTHTHTHKKHTYCVCKMGHLYDSPLNQHCPLSSSRSIDHVPGAEENARQVVSEWDQSKVFNVGVFFFSFFSQREVQAEGEGGDLAQDRGAGQAESPGRLLTAGCQQPTSRCSGSLRKPAGFMDLCWTPLCFCVVKSNGRPPSTPLFNVPYFRNISYRSL